MILKATSDRSRPAIAVEGLDDEGFIGRFLVEGVAYGWVDGRDNVTSFLEVLQRKGFSNGLGIVDSDFTDFGIPSSTNPDAIRTDDHDLGMTAARYSLDTVMSSVFSTSRIDQFNGSRFASVSLTDLRSQALEIAAIVGAYRLANEELDLGIDFDRVKSSKWFDNKLRLDREKVHASVQNIAGGGRKQLEQRATDHLTADHDPFALGTSHELAAALAAASSGGVGIAGGSHNRETVEALLLASMDRADFASTQIAESLRSRERELSATILHPEVSKPR